jgi:uncharacterized UBP type Zn finger protein
MSTTVSDEDLKYFLDNRAHFEANVSAGKVLRIKMADCCVGLLNAGSTCYLNSVIQCLFQSADFLYALQASNNEQPVIRELQRLFSFLEYSTRAAIATNDLLAAFGWSEGQAHEQHDAQEFFSLLLESVTGASAAFEGVESGWLANSVNTQKLN